MSTESNIATNPAYLKDELSGQRFVDVNDKLKIVESVIAREGNFKGFAYHYPVPKTLAGALEIFGNDEGALLDALEGRFSQMAYARALSRLRSKLPQDAGETETVKQWQNRHKADIEAIKLTDPVLFSVEDALNFRPGERELTPSGIIRQIGKLQSEAQKLLSAGKTADAMAKFNQLSELMSRFQAFNEQLQKQAAAIDGEEGGEEATGN